MSVREYFCVILPLSRTAPDVHLWSRKLQVLWSLNSGTDSDDTDDDETQIENRCADIRCCCQQYQFIAARNSFQFKAKCHTSCSFTYAITPFFFIKQTIFSHAVDLRITLCLDAFDCYIHSVLYNINSCDLFLHTFSRAFTTHLPFSEGAYVFFTDPEISNPLASHNKSTFLGIIPFKRQPAGEVPDSFTQTAIVSLTGTAEVFQDYLQLVICEHIG